MQNLPELTELLEVLNSLGIYIYIYLYINMYTAIHLIHTNGNAPNYSKGEKTGNTFSMWTVNSRPCGNHFHALQPVRHIKYITGARFNLIFLL